MVSSGSYLFPAIFTGSTAFGFCPGIRLPILSSTIGSILADHAGGLWVVADELIHLKGGAVTSHFAVNGTPFKA